MRIDEEFKNLIPPLSEDEFKQLEENILKEGVRESLIVWDLPSGDTILVDGHNRYKIATKHSLPYNIRKMKFENRNEVMLWMIKNALGQRNLQKIDSVILNQKYGEIIQKKAKKNQGTRTDLTSCPNGQKVEPIHTREEIAKLAGVGSGTVARVEQIQKKAPEKIEAIRKGEMTINQAYNQIAKPEGKKEQIRRIEEEHKAFEESKNDSIISFSKAKEDKENIEILAFEFLKMIIAGSDKIQAATFKYSDFPRFIETMNKSSRIGLTNSIRACENELKRIEQYL